MSALTAPFRYHRGQRIGANKLTTVPRCKVKLARFRQLEDHERCGAYGQGSFIDGEHRDSCVTITAPEDCSLTTLADDQYALSLDSDFGSFLHRCSFEMFPVNEFGIKMNTPSGPGIGKTFLLSTRLVPNAADNTRTPLAAYLESSEVPLRFFSKSSES